MLAPGRSRRAWWQVASVAVHSAVLGGAIWLARPPLAGGSMFVLVANPPAEPGPLRSPRTRPPREPVARETPARRNARRADPARSSLPAPQSPGVLPAALPALAPLDAPEDGGDGELTFAGEGTGGIAASARSFARRLGFEEGSPDEETSPWLRENHAEIFRRIEERIADEEYYPWAARVHGRQGVVRVAFTLRTDGTPCDLRITASSGHRDLDRCAIAAIRSAAPFPRPPRDETVVVPIWFRLR